jgi:MSHA biogenesis protein MshK
VSRLAAVALLLAVLPVAAQQGLGDPTRPTSMAEPEAARPVEAGPRWRLQSTLVADTRRLAVINGRTVAQGEHIEGALVREVRQEGVTLEVGGQRVELRMVPGSVNVKRSGG